jgi:hypothetical protein
MIRGRVRGVLTGLVLAAAVAPTAAGHGPDPAISWPLFNPDQALTFDWLAGEVPPAAMRSAIVDAAADANASRGSRAPTLALQTGARSSVEYGSSVFCGPNGLACADGWNAPESFRVAFRLHGHSFDWGTLRWCQLLTTIADGCFDVENIALDEFGHVLGLGHHANFADQSDYLDAVVQTVSRARPKAGWNASSFGRCDVAKLQLRYDMVNTARRFSTCLDLAVATTLTTTDSSIRAGETVILRASLKVTTSSAYERLSGNLLSERYVVLQRRTPGSTSFVTVGQMPAALASGAYEVSISPTATYEWRAFFAKPSEEGVRASSSKPFTITVSSGCVTNCPQRPSAISADGHGR